MTSEDLLVVDEETAELIRAFWARFRRWIHQNILCRLCGGHELYRTHTDTKLFQQCLLCGYETNGWELEPRIREQ